MRSTVEVRSTPLVPRSRPATAATWVSDAGGVPKSTVAVVVLLGDGRSIMTPVWLVPPTTVSGDFTA